MSWSGTLIWLLLCAFAFLVSPTALVWGWLERIRPRSGSWTLSFKLSFLGFLLATSSGLLAIAVILFALGGTFQNYEHMRLLYRSILIGAALSTFGFLFGVAGVWKSHSLRWQAPVSAIGTLAFWLIESSLFGS